MPPIILSAGLSRDERAALIDRLKIIRAKCRGGQGLVPAIILTAEEETARQHVMDALQDAVFASPGAPKPPVEDYLKMLDGNWNALNNWLMRTLHNQRRLLRDRR